MSALIECLKTCDLQFFKIKSYDIVWSFRFPNILSFTDLGLTATKITKPANSYARWSELNHTWDNNLEIDHAYSRRKQSLLVPNCSSLLVKICHFLSCIEIHLTSVYKCIINISNPSKWRGPRLTRVLFRVIANGSRVECFCIEQKISTKYQQWTHYRKL